jgi:predicted nuclease with TOPRIM domain
LSSQKATVIPSAKPAKLGLKDAVRDLETENHNLDGKLKEAMREINELKARIVELEEDADLCERLGEADLGHRPPNPNR